MVYILGRSLKQQMVKVAYEPQQTIRAFLRAPERDDSDRRKSGIVYKVNCTQCNFVYYDQTKIIEDPNWQWQVLTKTPKL